MRKIIDDAIANMWMLGIKASIIFLTDTDYEQFKHEVFTSSFIMPDACTGYPSSVDTYLGVVIDTRLPDIDEVDNPLLADSFIASSNIYQQYRLGNRLISEGRAFSLKTFEEIKH